MGASGWEYRVPFVDSVETSLTALQEKVLAEGDYIWPWEDMDPDFLEEMDDDEIPRRPTSLAALAEAKEIEDFWDEGTHTILDVERISPPEGPDEFAGIRPLTAAELRQVFGTEHPTAADLDRVHEPGPSGQLADLMGPKWSGRSLLLYPSSETTPVEVFFWGYSGD